MRLDARSMLDGAPVWLVLGLQRGLSELGITLKVTKAWDSTFRLSYRRSTSSLFMVPMTISTTLFPLHKILVVSAMGTIIASTMKDFDCLCWGNCGCFYYIRPLSSSVSCLGSGTIVVFITWDFSCCSLLLQQVVFTTWNLRLFWYNVGPLLLHLVAPAPWEIWLTSALGPYRLY